MVQMRLLLPVILAALVSAGPLLPQRSVYNGAQGSRATGYFTGWHAASYSNPVFGASNMSLNKYTHINYAFAITTAEGIPVINDDDKQILPKFVETAHLSNVSVSITVGGWTGSMFFSPIVATKDNRTAFIEALEAIVYTNSLQGADFDWEFPNHQGIGCNIVSPSDTDNLLLLFQEMRARPFWHNLTISAAVLPTTWVDASGAPSTKLNAFADVLDYIQIMDYDVWGYWDTNVGPNGPLDDGCAPAGDQHGSAKSGVAAWTNAGFSSSQILLGVASYGHAFNIPSTAAYASPGVLAPYPPIDKSKPKPTGDSWTGLAGGPDKCGAPGVAGDGIQFWGLVQLGFLDDAGNPHSGIDYRFDNCSQTAYVYNSATGVEVSYDDATAFAAKGGYIKSATLGGFSMWEAGGDHNDILLNAIIGGMK